jgi:hypothetical protein
VVGPLGRVVYTASNGAPLARLILWAVCDGPPVAPRSLQHVRGERVAADDWRVRHLVHHFTASAMAVIAARMEWYGRGWFTISRSPQRIAMLAAWYS